MVREIRHPNKAAGSPVPMRSAADARPLLLSVFPHGRQIEMLRGETVSDALRRAGIEIESPCNGNSTCGKCRVWVDDPGRVPKTPHETISADDEKRGLRLACALVPRSDMTIDIVVDDDGNCRILEGGDFRAGDQAADESRSTPCRPSARVAANGDGFVYRYHGHGEESPLTEWDPRYTPKGLAIDLGTTTLVMTLVSLETGAELATASVRNPQTRYGHDVMTRIQMGSTPDGLERLAESVRDALNELVAKVCAQSSSSPLEILDAVVGGNTTMLQLAAGIDPAPLGQYPFDVGIESGRTYAAMRFGLNVNPCARAYVPPVAHAFVGSDISAGLCGDWSFFDTDESTLFIDIGTNGELAVSADGECRVTSAAAGPAFEGMGLTSGMRATRGAVEGVDLDNGSVGWRTIGGAEPKGLCGSGVIELTAVMLEHGALEPSGRLAPPDQADTIPRALRKRLCEYDGKPAFAIADSTRYTQKDIRQVQLAKSAIRTAVDMLLDEAGVDEPGRVILAGGFGRSLNPDALEAIGMVPEGFTDKIRFAGNTSRSGCVKLLLDRELRNRIEKRMGRVEHVSLADKPEYMDRYVDNMAFPDPDEPASD